MSIGGIIGSSLSGLLANQSALRAVSTNIANLNTENYTRLETDFLNTSNSVGVTASVERAVDRFLQAAHFHSAAGASGAKLTASFLDRAQELLGDPSGQGTAFAALDEVFARVSTLSSDPSSFTSKSAVIDSVSRLLQRIEAMAGGIASLRNEVRLGLDQKMEESNQLLQEITRLNAVIAQSGMESGDASEAEALQETLLDRLSQLIDVRVHERPLGGVQLRTQTGGLILADNEAAELAYKEILPGEWEISAKLPRSEKSYQLGGQSKEGEIAGLIALDRRLLPDLAAGIGAFAAGVANILNTGHNQAWPNPAPMAVSGHNTGWLGSDNIGFTGIARLGLVDTSGQLTENIRIDFDAGTVTNNAGQQYPIGSNIDDFVTALNSALGTRGSASFANGRLNIEAASGGIVISQDENAPAQRAGRGFAAGFGLNNLIETTAPTSFATGLKTDDAHGFDIGDTITMAIRDERGNNVATRNFTISGTNIGDLLAGLDASLSGYATVRLDSAGRLEMTTLAGHSIEMVADPTQRGDTGMSFSSLFGTGQNIIAQQAFGMKIRSDIAAAPDRLGSAAPDLTGSAVGDLVLAAGDGRGALLLEAAADAKIRFTGIFGDQTVTIGEYGANLAGWIGQQATAATNSANAADAMHQTIHQRRQSAQGVNLDEELIKMTRYQQAYSAASRMMKASMELYDVLLRLV